MLVALILLCMFPTVNDDIMSLGEELLHGDYDGSSNASLHVKLFYLVNCISIIDQILLVSECRLYLSYRALGWLASSCFLYTYFSTLANAFIAYFSRPYSQDIILRDIPS